MWEDILWMLAYTALGVAVIFFALRVRKLRAELRELEEEKRAEEEAEETPDRDMDQ